jgi:site-specific DNA-methyltransferase (adenine-specific)
MSKIELFNEDCMEGMKRYPDKHFDLAIVDPPYGRGEDGRKNRSHNVKQKNGSMLYCKDGGYKKKHWDEIPGLDFFPELVRVTKQRIIWGMNYFPVLLNGGCIVWDKVNDGADQSGAEIAHCSMTNRVDVFRYMWRGMMQGESIENGTKQQGNKALNEKRIHPTQKPVVLYKCLLKTYAKEGDTILDTHLGSGSIAIACWDMGFDLTGFEIDKDYYDGAMKRLEDHKRQGVLNFTK